MRVPRKYSIESEVGHLDHFEGEFSGLFELEADGSLSVSLDGISRRSIWVFGVEVLDDGFWVRGSLLKDGQTMDDIRSVLGAFIDLRDLAPHIERESGNRTDPRVGEERTEPENQ